MGAEVNVISINRLKFISCLILTLNSKVRFRTTSGKFVGFEGIALVNIEVVEGIRYKVLFFLVKYTLITLLKQSFITITKIYFIYSENDLQKGVFLD